MALNAGVLEKLRRLCLSLPEAREVASFGHPCWKVAKKTFACFERYNGEQVVTFKTDPLEQDRLVASGDGYRIAPYVGRYGWVCQGVKSIRWPQLKVHIEQSYRMNAPKRLAALLDRNASAP
jgi:predicted DNA-binding protein (MmcQ/YjbR family)